MKSFYVDGSTGGMGQGTLDCIEILQKHGYEIDVAYLGCKNSIDKLEEQINQFHPKAVSVVDVGKANELARKVDIPVYSGEDGHLELIKKCHYDVFINTLYGSAGIMPTVDAINAGKTILIANKEPIMITGDYITNLAKEKIPDPKSPTGSRMIPLDDEPAAIYICCEKYNIPTSQIKEIILPCSGGALYEKSREEIINSTEEDTRGHPTFDMKPRMNRYSALLINKAHEFVQIKNLFGVTSEKIKTKIHRQSKIHGGIKTVERGRKKEYYWFGESDTRYKIFWALTHVDEQEVPKINLKEEFRIKDGREKQNDYFDATSQVLSLEGPPVPDKFPLYHQITKYADDNSTMLAALNAIGEISVGHFIDKDDKTVKSVKDIEDAFEHVIKTYKPIKNPSLKQIMESIEVVNEITEKYLDEKYESSQ
ncbi:MAG: hypothetical protein KAT37_03060 [Candidatus Aenigmarchaeota archaeon]|nr:hypothetical protein [Candidatus Aenigmarchaeota archaeon]